MAGRREVQLEPRVALSIGLAAVQLLGAIAVNEVITAVDPAARWAVIVIGVLTVVALAAAGVLLYREEWRHRAWIAPAAGLGASLVVALIAIL